METREILPKADKVSVVFERIEGPDNSCRYKLLG